MFSFSKKEMDYSTVSVTVSDDDDDGDDDNTFDDNNEFNFDEKDDEKQNKTKHVNDDMLHSHVINNERELKKVKEMIEIALTPIDETWTIETWNKNQNTKNTKPENNNNVLICSKESGNSGIYTTVGISSIDTKGYGSINDYYNYLECGYNDILHMTMNNNKTKKNSTIYELIDKNHQIMYETQKSGHMFIENRDFTLMQTRFKYDNYVFNNKKYGTIVGSLSYSIYKNNPFFISNKKGFIRGNYIRRGYVLYTTGEDTSKFNICFIMTMDPCARVGGYIPSNIAKHGAIANVTRNINIISQNWNDIMNILKLREKNEWKKDFLPLCESSTRSIYSPKLAAI